MNPLKDKERGRKLGHGGGGREKNGEGAGRRGGGKRGGGTAKKDEDKDEVNTFAVKGEWM